jgi:subtilisin-like proprotein convertase family protein
MPVMSGKHVLNLIGVAALIGAALVAIGTTRAEAAGVPCQRTYSSAPSAPIDDNSTTPDTIDVPEDGLIVSDVKVAVTVHHTFDADMVIAVESMTDALTTRAYVSLFERFGGNGDNLLGTVWDDDAALPISWGDAPFTGRFKAIRPLAALNGFAGGRYQLLVSDLSTGDTGTLDSWSLTFQYKSCDFDSDGVEDHADSCLGVTAHTATGCPATTRAVTATYKHGAFKGLLSSPVGSCKASRSVAIWKVRSGADKVVGTATTRSDGSYKLKRGRHVGRYYATSARVAATDVAECPAVQSTAFRIR